MFYKLSNIATRETMEREMKAMFKFPNLYKPKCVIDGTEESIIPIITSEAKHQIQFAIWGVLPEHGQVDWQPYQKQKNTLNVRITDIKNELQSHTNLKRCLIPITGYFGFYNTEGEVKSYYNVNATESPFCVAGVYNQLNDGFYTCALIVTQKTKALTSAGSINNLQPAILNKNDHEAWLNPENKWESALIALHNQHDYHIKRYATANKLSINTKVCDWYADLGLHDAV